MNNAFLFPVTSGGIPNHSIVLLMLTVSASKRWKADRSLQLWEREERVGIWFKSSVSCAFSLSYPPHLSPCPFIQQKQPWGASWEEEGMGEGSEGRHSFPLAHQQGRPTGSSGHQTESFFFRILVVTSPLCLPTFCSLPESRAGDGDPTVETKSLSRRNWQGIKWEWIASTVVKKKDS